MVANVAIPNTVNLLREARRRLVDAVEADTGQAQPDLHERYETDAFLREVPTAGTLLLSTRLSGELLAATAAFAGHGVAQARGLLEQVLRRAEGRLSNVVAPHARLGHKTPTKAFVGYKVHVAEDTSELVTSVQVLPGNAHEGSRLPELLDGEEGKGIRAGRRGGRQVV